MAARRPSLIAHFNPVKLGARSVAGMAAALPGSVGRRATAYSLREAHDAHRAVKQTFGHGALVGGAVGLLIGARNPAKARAAAAKKGGKGGGGAHRDSRGRFS